MEHVLRLHSQRGVALIMVLGMVAVIAAWASMAAYEDMIAIQRSSNIQDEVRGTMASESAFELVKLYLKVDYELTGNVDDLDEDWAIGIPPLPIDDGMIAVTIEDSNRYYNLNDLVNNSGAPVAKHVQQVKALFRAVNVDDTLVDALVDWMDKDNLPYGVAGAEDALYYDKNYKVKNARLDNMSELRLVLGFNDMIVQKLRAVACVRPSEANGNTKVNINTARPEVLLALFPNMSLLDVDALTENMPYESLGEVQSLPWIEGGDFPRLSVGSNAFTLRTHATFGRTQVREEFLLSRNQQTVQLVWRERLGWQL